MERNIAYKNTIDVASQEFDYSTTDPSTVKAVTAFAWPLALRNIYSCQFICLLFALASLVYIRTTALVRIIELYL